jgi:hypothetical protein
MAIDTEVYGNLQRLAEAQPKDEAITPTRLYGLLQQPQAFAACASYPADHPTSKPAVRGRESSNYSIAVLEPKYEHRIREQSGYDKGRESGSEHWRR